MTILKPSYKERIHAKSTLWGLHLSISLRCLNAAHFGHRGRIVAKSLSNFAHVGSDGETVHTEFGFSQ